MARTKTINVQFEALPGEPPVVRRKPGVSPLGEWFNRHPAITYEAAARKLKCTRQSVQGISRGRADPGLQLAGRIELWTRTVDAKDYVRMQAWVS